MQQRGIDSGHNVFESGNRAHRYPHIVRLIDIVPGMRSR